MGQRSARKAAFLKQHPLCCFCGGNIRSAEPDHVPSRAVFRSRQWPEGYEFPACVRCNRGTRHDEQVVAMLARSYPDPETPEEKAEVGELFRAVAHNYPDVLREMQPTQRQLRTAAAKYGLTKPDGGMFKDIPALSVNGPLVNTAVQNFARKLFCALYYKHAERILSPVAGIAVRWFSNLQLEADEIPRSLSEILIGLPKLERSSKLLNDQFFYRWVVSDTKDMAVFLVFFNQSFGILGSVHQRVLELRLPDGVTVLRPNDAQQSAPEDALKQRASERRR